MMNKTRRGLLAVSVALFMLGSMPAKAFFCVNCAEEYTQYANYLTLAMQLKNQATQLENEAMHLATLPADFVNSITGPYRQKLAEIKALYSSISDLRNQTINSEAIVKRRYQEMRQMNLSPTQYWQAEADLAKTQHGVYEKQLKDDLQALQNAQQSAQTYQDLQGQISGIDGDVKGFQTLAQYSHMMTGELSQMNQLIRRQMVAATQQSSDQTDQAASSKKLTMSEYQADQNKQQSVGTSASNVQVQLPRLVK